ncbi:Glycine/D-amino acid oxidase [Roseovarius litoreus]|uniref:Glycine/D-amino acid oxidase n=1 Tax=Roseovarius litoreus TaxID=1155722 RepID=A0A1M7C4K7_9RHOB|nr:FAD-binding oxidoreductase [Roseovarius litoreus]SHL61779.1 Glycine/D-amino acid oxidase [Roseovarius litoreus]
MAHWTGEAEPGHPWWWEAAPPVPDSDDLPKTCDVLVIGAGYTGLSAAIAAHDCGAQVVVVDAGVPGQGASSRNGGMFGAHPRLGWSELERKFGAATADALFAEAKPALEWTRGLIEAEGIDCDFQQTGRIQLAWTPGHFENQKRLAKSVQDKSDVAVHLVQRADLNKEISTDKYHGAIVFPEHGAIHPAKFHRGLLEAVRRRGVPVVAHAGVTDLRREGAGRFRVKTAKGELQAEKVILGTNGYTTKPFGWHVQRVFPLPSYLISTEELPSNLIGHLAPGRRMMVETRARHSYFRISPDGKRVLFGGRASMRDLPIKTAAERLHETMSGIWPELRDTKISHAWYGFTGYSFNHMPQVGEQNGIFYAMGYSGSGTVMAPYLGAKAAYLAMGDARAETAYANTLFKKHFLHQFQKPHFLKAADLYYRHWVDRVENWQAR